MFSAADIPGPRGCQMQMQSNKSRRWTRLQSINFVKWQRHICRPGCQMRRRAAPQRRRPQQADSRSRGFPSSPALPRVGLLQFALRKKLESLLDILARVCYTACMESKLSIKRRRRHEKPAGSAAQGAGHPSGGTGAHSRGFAADHWLAGKRTLQPFDFAGLPHRPLFGVAIEEIFLYEEDEVQ